jgi:hypothetical protein
MEDHMKRLHYLVLAAVLACAFSAPASAAEKTTEERVKALEDVFGGWSIYGSIRFATFYEAASSDFTGDTDSVTKINSSAALTRPAQKITQWGLASNSRIGLAVDRKDNFSGRVEMGLGNDGTVKLRLGYGTCTYNGITFLVGQDFTPLSEWDYSAQVFCGDNNLAGWGVIDVEGKRIPQLKIKWNGLQVALVHPKNPSTLGLASSANATTEILLPNLEAKYRLTMDRFFADVFGGVGTYKVKSDVLDIDKTVTSYAAGVGGGVKLDPVYAKAMFWMARNGRQLSLHQADAAGATLDADNSVIDDDDLGYAFILGSKIGSMTAEAGYGFVSSEKDLSGAKKDKARNYYANLTIPVVQNAARTASITIVPEVGVYDYMKDSSGNDQGKITYAGAKWQINF